MVCEKMEQSGSVEPTLASDPFLKLSESTVEPKENGISSHLASSSQKASSSNKSDGDEKGVGEQDEQYPPSTYCDYYYPGYDGAFSQLDDCVFGNTGNGSSLGLQADQGSLAYFMPGYGPYAAGTFVGADGQQQYFSSSGYLQHPSSYGIEAVPCYSWDQNFSGDAMNGPNAIHEKPRSSPSKTMSNGVKSSKTCSSGTSRLPGFSTNSRPRPFYSSSTDSNPTFGTQPQRSSNKVPQPGYNFQSSGLMNFYRPAGNFSSFPYQKQGIFPNGAPTHKSNGRPWNGNDRFKLREKSCKNGGIEGAVELTCGPRAQNRNSSIATASEKKQLGVTFSKDVYNLPDFPTEYENAKFYVIKSYSEDDIHKCVKYNVWSSTPSGNKKLHAAFQDAEAKAGELGSRCPVFLFFSVNGSGQFIGLAEMIGRVDFYKNMDFWQLDKWNGFFPVKWHVVKDIPNAQLRHIILENNDNRPVTYTRDAQEVGLKKGLEMLKIFKKFSAKTSVLDDFNFYDDREKAFQANKSCKSAMHRMEKHEDCELPKDERSGAEISDLAKPGAALDPVSSLVDLTKNLSVDASDPNPVV